MHKPTALEILLENAHNIHIFKNIEHGEICSLVNEISLKNISKDEFVVKEYTNSTSAISIVLYGSFTVSINGNKVGELKEGDMCGIGGILYGDASYISKTTIQASSFKNLILSFKISSKYIEPCATSAKLYKNIATYFANKLSLEHKSFDPCK